MLVFGGSFEEHREFFLSEWGKLAEENERLAIFDDEGLAGLSRLPKLETPPLPEIDEEQTARANAVLQEARKRVADIGVESNLTLNDCSDILDEVDAEMKASNEARCLEPGDIG